MLHEIFEETVFARLQQNMLAAARHAMRQPVEHEITDRITRLLFFRHGAPSQRLDARE